ncbi:MAG: phospho-sugar mutase, partial [Actinobacteria bacterium]|nr:phospho-sugar mutase [Actinomycetota bacterium]
MDAKLIAEVERWIAEDPDPTTQSELRRLLELRDEATLRSCFSGFLEFGTAGLRGPLGPGPSRMNRAVVTKTAAGLAQYMKKNSLHSVVIGRDARYGSEDFTRDTAEIMQGAGFEVYLGGTVNGVRYDGSQIIAPADKEISHEIAQVPPLPTLKRSQGWKVLDEEIIEKYIRTTAALADAPADLSVVYTAMHGVGTETIEKVFAAAGFSPLILVPEQAHPDPDFPTVAFPNPEEPGAIDLALAKAQAVKADLVIANDPDADRCAAAIADAHGKWRMLRGDEVGALLGEYIAGAGKKPGVIANSIVSSSILKKIAEAHSYPFQETLTGFKWIAKIPNLVFGYEEALGYCVDSHSVNDKDGISAALALTQLALNLKKQGRTIDAYLDEIWSKYGYHATKQISVRTTSVDDMTKVLGQIRAHVPESIGKFAVVKFDDLETPTDGLPPTNGVRFFLSGDVRVIIRPSGTEPKIKCYIEVVRKGEVSAAKAEAHQVMDSLDGDLRKLL